jgi:hypothetical protein
MTKSKSPFSAAHYNFKKGGRAKTHFRRGSGAGTAPDEHLLAAGKKSTARLDRRRREAGGATNVFDPPAGYTPPPQPPPLKGSFTGVGEATSGRASSPPPSYWEPPMESEPERAGGRTR